MWGILFVYCNMKRQPKITKDILINQRQFGHLKNTSQYREVLEIYGLSVDQLNDLREIWGSNFTKQFGRSGGRIRTLNKMIKLREEKIKTREDEIKDYKEQLEKLKGIFSPMIKSLSPKINLKKPRKNYPYWKGRVWWNIGYNTDKRGFNTKNRRIDFHICSEKEQKEMNYSIDDMKQIGVRKFRQRILHQDFGILSKK